MQKKIEEYIKKQLQEDIEYDQMTLKEYIDPFTGEPVKQGEERPVNGHPENEVWLADRIRASLDARQVTVPYRDRTNYRLSR